MLTHRNMYFDVANSIPGLRSLFHEESSTLLFLPLAHSFARLIQIGCVQARARMGRVRFPGALLLVPGGTFQNREQVSRRAAERAVRPASQARAALLRW